ncbi:MAG: class I SAM-dependent methyltransferase [Bacteroidetes bacterium]|nr:class I SAM-dependent methyltransferase [Bacteroidota bacterium]
MKEKWTGERLETFVFNETTIEHLHRYALVMPFVENKAVLDIACGEGYGSKLIASKARQVTGVDIDAETIQTAQAKYKAANLSYKQGSADQIPVADLSVDVVVSFETIEHHDKHEEMMQEVKRVLKPGGVLIISSPEKTGEVSFNEFHVKELTFNEFKELISKHFRFHKFYNQKIVHGSLVAPAESDRGSGFQFGDGSFDRVNLYPKIPSSIFNICIASDENDVSLPTSFFDGSEMLHKNIVSPYQNSRLYKLGNLLNVFRRK